LIEGYYVEFSGLSLHEVKPVVQFEVSQEELLANVLGRAFQDEPNFIYVLPEERSRGEVLPSFFLGAIRVAQRYGQIDTTPMIDAGALWICPGRELTFSEIVRAGTSAIALKLGWQTFKRCMKLSRSVSEIHGRLASEPHWYLLTLGAEPSQQGPSIAGALLEPGLSRADSDGLLCYLETFQEAELPFYKGLGFRIAGAGCIPGGPCFWAMIRLPRRQRCLNSSC
jgi:hypothetical protein